MLRVDKYRRLQRLPHLWLCDGVVDCEDEMDENRTNWHECKHTQAELPWQLHHAECVEHKDKCVSWFICPENGGKNNLTVVREKDRDGEIDGDREKDRDRGPSNKYI